MNNLRQPGRSKWQTDTYLECEAKVDDQGIGQGIDIDPFAIVGELQAGDRAREEEGEEVAVAVGR
jgi:hypothetical protein